MKPAIPQVPPRDEDAAAFRAAVRRSIPWFFAVLCMLGVGTVLTRLVFTVHHPWPERGLFVNLQGAALAGGDAQGEDLDEGTKGEKSLDPDEAAGAEAKASDVPPPLEPSRWLEKPAETAPIGPRSSPAMDPDAGGGSPKPSPAARGGTGTGKKGNGPGSGSPWGSRTGTGRGDGVRLRGGNQASESAVEAGLDWLRRHQAENGVWRADGFGRFCSTGRPCEGEALQGVNYDAGVTALALVAYLGGGYTHTEGRFQATVRKGLGYLMTVQDGEGRFGAESMYTQCFGVLALAEAYGLTADPALEKPLERALHFLLRAQQLRGGWSYDPQPKRERNDTSITAFAVMALKAAQAAGMNVPGKAFDAARGHILRATEAAGTVWYADAPPGWGRKGLGMVAAGLFTSLLLGRSPEDPMVERQTALLRSKFPAWDASRELDQSFVTWYYENLSFFAIGGSTWARWNPAFRDFLLARQKREGCADGSWDPDDLWGNTGGRVYSTAIHVLNLEVYYKYAPGFLAPGEETWTEDAPEAAPEEASPGKAPSSGAGADEAAKERLRRLKELLGGGKGK